MTYTNDLLQSIETNKSPEQVFLTRDAGKTWADVTGNLRAASGVVGKVRPGGLLLVDLKTNDDQVRREEEGS